MHLILGASRKNEKYAVYIIYIIKRKETVCLFVIGLFVRGVLEPDKRRLLYTMHKNTPAKIVIFYIKIF